MKSIKTFLFLIVLSSITIKVEPNSISNKSNDSTVLKGIQLIVKYEAEKKVREIEILSKQHDLYELKLKRSLLINICITIISAVFCLSWIIFMIKFYRLKKLTEIMKEKK
jgi:hypothetical protein